MSRSFNFGYTCPDIDKGINRIKIDLESSITNLIEDLCPRIEGLPLQNLAKEFTEKFYEAIEPAIENVRDTNQSLRREAENQIGDLESDLRDARSELDDARREIDRLEDKVRDLESELAEP